MVRAILESIVFRIVLAYNALKEETNINVKKMSVDGGVSKNDFICQLLADMMGLEVERSSIADISVLGCGFLTGLSDGVLIKKIESYEF